MAKDKRSRDQKRKAKLAERARKRQSSVLVEPYDGRKYQMPAWTPLVYATESAVYEVIRLTDRRLTNDTVQRALTQLVLDLRRELAPTLIAGEPQPALEVGNEVPYLIWNIRSRWTAFFEEEHPVAIADLIGVLRTMLHSIEAHAWNSGKDRGYVAFLQQFMEGGPLGEGGKITWREDDWGDV